MVAVHQVDGFDQMRADYCDGYGDGYGDGDGYGYDYGDGDG